MRCFVAIDLPGHLKKKVENHTRQIRQEFPNLKWVDPKNYHLTLKFLGEVKDSVVPQIVSDLAVSIRTFSPFVLRLKGMGAFPHPRQARVLWIGVNGETEQARALFETIEDIVVRYGIPKEKRGFKMHLTLARARRPVDLRHLEHSPVPEETFMVREIVFFQSELHPEGARYTPIQRMKLHGTGRS